MRSVARRSLTARLLGLGAILLGLGVLALLALRALPPPRAPALS